VDTHRTDVTELAAAPEQVTAKPTRTRWWILLLISLMYLIAYMDRSNISVAQPEIAKQFGMSKTAMGLVLAAFTWAYALGQVPAGWLGDRFGPKRVLAVIMSWWAIAAAMTGAAVGLYSLFSARFLLGLGEAGAFPVASRGMQLWFPRSERGRIQGTTHFFSRFAVAVTPLVAGSIMLAFGWRAIFFIFGSLGVIWAIAFSFFYRNLPEEHKSVNVAELAQIRGLNPDGSVRAPNTTRPSAPWKRIFVSPNMWYISLGYSCFFFGTNFYLTWYPTYLREHRHLTLQALGLIGSLPLFAGMLGDLTGGTLSDLFFKRTGNARFARRIVAAPGFLLAGVFVIPAAMTHDALTSVLFLAISFFFLEFVIGPAWAVPMDVGGQFSGTVTGIMNMAGALAASLTAIVYGGLFDKGYWIAPFFVSAGVMLAGALIWTFLIDPERSVVEARSGGQ
jgi:sugar phosphate permease